MMQDLRGRGHTIMPLGPCPHTTLTMTPMVSLGPCQAMAHMATMPLGRCLISQAKDPMVDPTRARGLLTLPQDRCLTLV